MQTKRDYQSFLRPFWWAAKLILFNLVLTLLLGELAAYLVARIRLGESYGTLAATRAEFLRKLPQVPDEPKATPSRNRTRDNLPRRLHPYFGYTYAGDLKS